MATAYRLNSESPHGFVMASQSNNGKTVTVFLQEADEAEHHATVTFDTADFLKYMTTLLKNWGK